MSKFRTSALPLGLAALMLPLTACSAHVSTDDDTPTQAIDYASLKNFTGVTLAGPDDVQITVGKGFSVGVEGDPKTIAKLKIEVVNGTLRIGRKKESGGWWGHTGGSDKGLIIRVSMPAIATADLTGSGDLAIDRADGKDLALRLTGSGDLSVAAANVGKLDAAVTGSGGIDLAGTVGMVDLSATGSGDVNGERMRAGGGKASVTGSGSIAFASDGPVDVSILGSGDVTVKGAAKCTSRVMGSGEAHCGA